MYTWIMLNCPMFHWCINIILVTGCILGRRERYRKLRKSYWEIATKERLYKLKTMKIKSQDSINMSLKGIQNLILFSKDKHKLINCEMYN